MNAKVIDHSYSLEDYHKDKGFLTKTLLSKLADNPQRFNWAMNGGKEPETKPQLKGTAAHVLCTQKELWDLLYFSMPDETPDGKQLKKDVRHKAYQEILRIANGRIVLKDSEIAELRRLGEAMEASPKAAHLLSGNQLIEQTICWERDNGILLKTRPDIIRLDDDTVVDIKTTARANPEAFFRVASDKHYDLSVALTAEGFQEAFGRPLKDYLFLCIEMRDPFIAEIYSAFMPMEPGEGSYLQYGQVKLERLLDKYQDCMESGVWPSYNDGVTPMKIPNWTMRQINRQLDEELADAD